MKWFWWIKRCTSRITTRWGHLSGLKIDILNTGEYQPVPHTREIANTCRLILLTTTFAIPVLLSCLRFTPVPITLATKLHAIINQPTIPSRYGYTTPAIGQSLFIIYIIGLNIILSCAGYRSSAPNAWYTSQSREIATYITNRAGVLSFVNMTILFLFAGRNNILLTLTNWSHSTFILLHKVLGCIAVLQACLHSAIYLNFRLVDGTYSTEVKERYWIMGILGTLAMTLILPLSIGKIRKAAYEVFLITHIVLSVLAVLRCWYHIIWRFNHTWGYETWLYIAIAFWAFDRVARLGKMVRAGRGRMVITKIDEDYLRLDGFMTRGMLKGNGVYLYFPSLSWRVWENHPFSIAGVGCILLGQSSIVDRQKEQGKDLDIEMSRTRSDDPALPTIDRVEETRSTFTVLVRVQKGTTLALAKRSTFSNTSIPVSLPILMEAYNHDHRPIHFINPTAPEITEYPNIIFLAGGVGITAFLPIISLYTQQQHFGKVKLYWSTRSLGLVKTVQEMLPLYGREGEKGVWGEIDGHIQVGTRLDLEGIVNELQDACEGTMIYMCGPKGMMGDIRELVAEKGKQGVKVRLFDERFNW
jgi:predicted ferric reductase